MRITEIAHRGRGSEHLFLVLVAIACGLAGALGAVLFRTLIQLFQEAFFGSPDFLARTLLRPHRIR